MKLRVFIHEHPHVFHISLASFLAINALSMTPSALPLTMTLAILLLYAPRLFNRDYGYTALLWLSVSLFGSIGRVAPALSALSTSGTSIAVVLVAASITSALAIAGVAIDFFACKKWGSAYQIVVFPAIWSSLWISSSFVLPLGRLPSWSPVLGVQGYDWMLPWVGPGGIDWVVGAWAVVISQAIGSWFMGNPDEDDSVRSQPTGRTVLAVILAALTIPSFLSSGLPLPVSPSGSITPLEVGCALPPFWRTNHTTPTVEDYITHSRTLTSAKIVLWPEGAVSFRNASEKEAGLLDIATKIGAQYTYWAVSFEEDINDVRHTGVALLSRHSDGPRVEMEYLKRHLVPVAESSYLTPGTQPPPLYSFPLSPPNHYKGEWAENKTRPISLTSSICLDFAMPSPFQDLTSKPALILAPARTWDPAIGRRMWEEVKQRANEIGSIALWCDGGKGGVSGVAGGGYNDVYQVSEGSWSLTIGIRYPFDSTRTLYARFGDSLVLLASWVFVIGPSIIWRFGPVAHRAHVLAGVFGVQILEKIGVRRGRSENLIDFES
ncbi:hypothetical protein FB45DRAFT_794109 [Roridomyces roridus]|uniref:CN hydrolase domain-containing protein n=1 Tax=Roridomyces roridus TaxID=1738132 RepID=A0AAD7FP83_9AGAR|nr:hypothetical protein FB45DRAFT_794109 [Roridomyces roridus]